MAKPIQSGDYDNLDGIYALTNAITNVAALKPEQQKALFKEFISYLDSNKVLKMAVLDGISKTKINELIGVAKKYLKDTLKLELKSKMVAESAGNINGIWTAINDFLNEKDVKEKRIVFTAIGITRENWTVIEKISDKRVNLCDTKGLQHIDKTDMNSSETKPNLYTIFKETIWGLSVSAAK